jgi:hypothetical protein
MSRTTSEKSRRNMCRHAASDLFTHGDFTDQAADTTLPAVIRRINAMYGSYGMQATEEEAQAAIDWVNRDNLPDVAAKGQ